jgi:hypothetical protein
VRARAVGRCRDRHFVSHRATARSPRCHGEPNTCWRAIHMLRRAVVALNALVVPRPISARRSRPRATAPLRAPASSSRPQRAGA